MVDVLLREISSCSCVTRALKGTLSSAHQALRDHLVSQAEATMAGQDLRGHPALLDLLEDHTLESPVSLHPRHTQMSKRTSLT